MSNVPKVSVVTITYNQEKYIRETLDSFVMQKTTFDFEVIVADDSSTDKTPEIIVQYTKAHPNIFKPVLRKKNIGIQKNCIDAFMKASGEYIAFCEGDDYWTDPQKLQEQVEFMEANPIYALSFHPVKVLFEGSQQKGHIYPDTKLKTNFDLEELLRGNYIQSNSVMYKRQKYKNLPDNILPLDWYLHLYHAQFGKIGFINKTMSVYRRHNKGVWWDSHNDKAKFWEKHGLSHLAMYEELLKIYGNNPVRRELINVLAARALDAIKDIDNKHILEQAVITYPWGLMAYSSYQQKLLRENVKLVSQTKAIVKHKDEEIRRLQYVVELKENHIQNIEAELKKVTESKVWKIGSRFRRNP